MFKRLFGKKSGPTAARTNDSGTADPPLMWNWLVEEAPVRAGDAITAGFLTDWGYALSKATYANCRAFARSDAFPEFAGMNADRHLSLRVAAFAANWLTNITIDDRPEMFKMNGTVDDIGLMMMHDMRNAAKRMYPDDDPILSRAIDLHIQEYSYSPKSDGKLSRKLEMINAFISLATGEAIQLLPLSDDNPDATSAVVQQHKDGMQRYLAFAAIMASCRSLPAEFLEEALSAK